MKMRFKIKTLMIKNHKIVSDSQNQIKMFRKKRLECIVLDNIMKIIMKKMNKTKQFGKFS